jgi:hypothetical protein
MRLCSFIRFSPFKYLARIPALGLVGLMLATHIFGADEDLARQLLVQALKNQYRGHYQATMEIVNETFPLGLDTLSGQAEFSDEIGERRISLASPKKAFEYHSLQFGREQWITDDNSHRIRRIANRQWKKGLVGSLLTYEDMLKLPTDFFLEYSSCKGLKAMDSTYQLSMSLKPLFQSFYSRLEVTLTKNPVLLKSITFYGQGQQKIKTMTIVGYHQVENKWLISDLTVSDCDSLSSLRMCFRHYSFAPMPIAQNARAKPARFSLYSQGKWDDSEKSSETDLEGSDLESADGVKN